MDVDIAKMAEDIRCEIKRNWGAMRVGLFAFALCVFSQVLNLEPKRLTGRWRWVTIPVVTIVGYSIVQNVRTIVWLYRRILGMKRLLRNLEQ